MNRPLKKLTRELRREKCPPHVLDRVFEQVEAPRHRRTPLWMVLSPVAACAALALAVLLWPEGKPASGLDRVPELVVTPDSRLNDRQLAAETEASIVLVSHILRENGRQGGQQVLDAALPSLQSSLESLQTLQGILKTEPSNQTQQNET